MEDEGIKLLLFAVIQEQDQASVINAIDRLRLPSVCLSSVGGFLGRRNTTLLVGLPDGRENTVLKALEESTRQRLEYLTLRLEGPPLPLLTPIPTTVSGATVFALPVEHFEKM